jgi:hypothetical protein
LPDSKPLSIKDSFTLKGLVPPAPNECLVICIPVHMPVAQKTPVVSTSGSTEAVSAPVEVPHEEEDEDVAVPTLDLNGELDNINVKAVIAGHYYEDPKFKSVVEKPSEHKNFVYDDKDKLLYLSQDGKRLLCIPNVFTGGHSRDCYLGGPYLVGSFGVS